MASNGDIKSFESVILKNANADTHPDLTNKILGYLEAVATDGYVPPDEIIDAIYGLAPQDPEAQTALESLVEELQAAGLVLAIVSDGGGVDAAIGVEVNGVAVTTVIALDPQNDPVTYSIVGGADASLFHIDPNTGALTLVDAPDYEAPLDADGDNVYDVVVQAIDAVSGQYDIQNLAASILNENEPPTFLPSGDDTGIVDEDGEDAPETVSGQLFAEDPDAGDTLTYSVVDAGVGAYGTLSIDNNGVWTYVLNNDSEIVQELSQEDSVLETFVVVATDSGGLDDQRVVTITVTGSDDGPVMENFWTGTEASETFGGYIGNTRAIGFEGDDLIYGDSSTFSIVGDAYFLAGEHPGGTTPNSGNISDLGFSHTGPGNDLIDAHSGDDTVYGESMTLGVSRNEWTFGSDTISGGTGADYLAGEADQIGVNGQSRYDAVGRGGNDVIDGGEDADEIYGDAEIMYAKVQKTTEDGYAFLYGGDDTVSGGGGNDTVSGDGRDIYVRHSDNRRVSVYSETALFGGDDLVDGGSGSDILYGDAERGMAYSFNSSFIDDPEVGSGIDSMIGGNDTILGGEDNDRIYGDFNRMYGKSTEVDEIAIVAGGDDSLSGGNGNDYIYGDAALLDSYDTSGVQNVRFIAGSDTIEGGAGDDQLWGDFGRLSLRPGSGAPDVEFGADTFVFNPGCGIDTIHDFQKGLDLMDVSGFGVVDFEQLKISVEIVPGEKSRTIIDLDGTLQDVEEIVLIGNVALDAGDFIFST